MKLCGLTGGVGMGKSTAAGFFLKLGARVVDTDEIARALVLPDQPALREIQSQFGDHLITTSGELKRDELAHIVFADDFARKKLEAILHPRIRETWLAQIETWRQEKCSVAIVVIPLLFETQAETSFEKIICVASSSVSQQQRLRQRNWSIEQIQQRIASQLPVEQKITRANYIMWTEGSLSAHESQAARVFEKL